MDKLIISGIQQIGIGVPDVYSAWKLYREYFGVNTKIFDEHATADIMAPYMGGVERERHAILAMNLQGGGGFEIWQHLTTPPHPAHFDILPGDLGIFACKIKCKNVSETHNFFSNKQADISPIYKDCQGNDFFYFRDVYKNIFQLVKSDDWFIDQHKPTGGTVGVMIGTNDMEKSINFYSTLLGYDTLISDRTDTFEDFSYWGTPNNRFRRVLLTHAKKREGVFSRLLTTSEIELVQALDRNNVHKIYEGRMWGDMGFIQLCFDVANMSQLEKRCEEAGYPLTIDSRKKNNKFDMGKAAGDFAYNEDPSGTLIEYVETKKIPVLKKLGIYLNIKRFNPNKPIPDWILKLLRFMEEK
ncbi:MAG: VOC family protein [Bacteroidales bacterium]|jgi:catechol 2,3-dioxygenase-like lactoylglutathione lyase family enzyme|nr:VOC family protein [Bacteroidales bacterium]